MESQKLVEQEMEREREANLMMQREWEEEEKRTEERLRKEAEEEAKVSIELYCSLDFVVGQYITHQALKNIGLFCKTMT